MEVREAYNYLGNIISDGFISLGIKYKDFSIVLKSLSDIEVRYLKVKNNCGTFDQVPVLDKIIYSTYFLSGEDILIDRDKNFTELELFYKSLPVCVINSLSKSVDTLFDKFVESYRYLEGFCYTLKSRHTWSLYKAKNGAGSFSVCPNVIQDQWVGSNVSMDKEDSEESSTDLALFVASAFNPKGVKSASNVVKLKRDERRKEREEIAIYGYNKKRIDAKRELEKWSTPLITNDDLVRELKKVSRGEKDKHDLFIDKWIRDKADLAARVKERSEERAKAYQKKYIESSGDKEGSRRASKEEVSNMLTKEKGRTIHTDTYSSAYEGVGKSDEFIKKIGSRVLRSKT